MRDRGSSGLELVIMKSHETRRLVRPFGLDGSRGEHSDDPGIGWLAGSESRPGAAFLLNDLASIYDNPVVSSK